MTGRCGYRNVSLPALALSGRARTHQRCPLLEGNPDGICSLRAFPLMTREADVLLSQALRLA